MSLSRTDARRRNHVDGRLALALLGAFVLIAGCARAPKPRADVPTDTTRTAGKGGTTKRPAPAGGTGSGNGAAVPGVTSGSSTSQPVVVPQLPPAEQERLERETKVAMETAQKALDGIDSAKLDVEKNRKFVIAKDFLVQAADARTNREFERAQALAQKARLLAEEIAPR